MAWIQYDVDKLESMKKQVDNTVTTLQTSKTQLIENLDSLQNDWNTPAGKKFLSEVDTDWADEIDKYIKALKTLSNLLKSAKKSYTALDDQIDQLPKP